MRGEDQATGTKLRWRMLLGLLLVLFVTSAVPGHARGGHGGGHGGHRGHRGHRGGHGGHRGGPGDPGFIGPRLGVSIWPYWDSYWAPYAVPSVVVTPPPQVYVQPAPPTWYYCDNPQGYYPYVQQCPGGWRPVVPTPP